MLVSALTASPFLVSAQQTTPAQDVREQQKSAPAQAVPAPRTTGVTPDAKAGAALVTELKSTD